MLNSSDGNWSITANDGPFPFSVVSLLRVLLLTETAGRAPGILEEGAHVDR